MAWIGFNRLIGAPLVGWLADEFGSLDVGFIFIGSGTCMSAIMFAFLPAIHSSYYGQDKEVSLSSD